MDKTGVPTENHQPVASHGQTLSHNVVSSTPRLSGIRTDGRKRKGHSRIENQEIHALLGLRHKQRQNT